jgi:ABC-type amino acid transport substrate-binding protein
VLIHKGNPRAEELRDMLNRGLAKLKETGEFQRIAGEHLSRFWAEQ